MAHPEPCFVKFQVAGGVPVFWESSYPNISVRVSDTRQAVFLSIVPRVLSTLDLSMVRICERTIRPSRPSKKTGMWVG